MRAHIVFAALQTQNRFALCHLAFKSIRELHKPSTRIQDTANDVLRRLAGVEGTTGCGQRKSDRETLLKTNQDSPRLHLRRQYRRSHTLTLVMSFLPVESSRKSTGAKCAECVRPWEGFLGHPARTKEAS